MLINYLRNNCMVYPEFETDNEEKMFKIELKYWEIEVEDSTSQMSPPHDIKLSLKTFENEMIEEGPPAEKE